MSHECFPWLIQAWTCSIVFQRSVSQNDLISKQKKKKRNKTKQKTKPQKTRKTKTRKKNPKIKCKLCHSSNSLSVWGGVVQLEDFTSSLSINYSNTMLFFFVLRKMKGDVIS